MACYVTGSKTHPINLNTNTIKKGLNYLNTGGGVVFMGVMG